jgi:hypothetical protein
MLAHPNRFQWVAQYTDGSELRQVESDGKTNPYEAINRDKLVGFEIWESRSKILYIKVSPQENLIWRRRIEMSGNEIKEVCHIICKINKDDPNNMSIVTIFESDSRVEGASEFKLNHPWLSPIELHPNEKI